MPQYVNDTFDVGYPVYCASFISESRLLVGGGGGEGNHGIPNKLTLFARKKRPDKSESKKTAENDASATEAGFGLSAEYELPKSSDAPTSMSSSPENGIVAVGVSDGQDFSKSAGINKHLKLFLVEPGRITLKSRHEVFKGSSTEDEYQKFTVFSPSGKLLLVASEREVYILNASTLQPLLGPIIFKEDIQDVSISNDDSLFACATKHEITVFSSKHGDKIDNIGSIKESFFRTVRFTEGSSLLVGSNSSNRKNGYIYKITLQTHKLEKLALPKHMHSIHSMDLQKDFAAIAGSDCSVAIILVSSLKVRFVFKHLHSFTITKVVLSPEAKYLASTSISNTVNILRIPDGSSKQMAIVWTLVSLLLIVVIAVLIELVLLSRLDRTFLFGQIEPLLKREMIDGKLHGEVAEVIRSRVEKVASHVASRVSYARDWQRTI